MKKMCVLAGILISLVVTGFVVNAKQSRMQQDLAEEVFRFHVLANSDSEEDQALKMQVKEAVITYMKEEIPDSDSVETTKEWARNHLDAIVNLAKAVIQEEGYDYPVQVEVTKMWFETRSYDGFTLPAGDYDAVRIIIGAGEGKNWWCVMYPALCIPGAEKAIEQYGENAEFITGSGYELRFAVIEWIEQIKQLLKK